jgi:hypothetical protein
MSIAVSPADSDRLGYKVKAITITYEIPLEHNIHHQNPVLLYRDNPALPTSLTEGRQVVDTLEICLDAWSDFRVDTS